MARSATLAAIALLAALSAGCAVYGGAGAVRIDGDTMETSSASARVGTDGVSGQTGRSVRVLR